MTTRLICWLCLRRLQEPVREKEREKCWQNYRRALRNPSCRFGESGHFAFLQKKVQVGADHSKFVCKILHQTKCVFLWFVATSPQFGFLAVVCGCRAPLVVALRNRRYSRNGCHHIIAHVPLVSTLLKASHKMQPNCVQRKQEQQIFSYRFADHKGKTAFMEQEENYQDWFAVMISHSCTCSMLMVIQSVPLFHQYVTTTNWQQKPG